MSGQQRCCPNGDGGVDCTCQNWPYTGLVIEGYQYRRYQSGAVPFWTPLGFPGQYYDAETDLFENWSRYYDSAIGRYLQTEPVLQSSDFIVSRALNGVSTSVYAYVSNNPIAFVDKDGLVDNNGCQFGSSCNACRAQAFRMTPGPLRECVLGQCSSQDTKLKCDEDAKKTCDQSPSQAKGKKEVEEGR